MRPLESAEKIQIKCFLPHHNEKHCEVYASKKTASQHQPGERRQVPTIKAYERKWERCGNQTRN